MVTAAEGRPIAEDGDLGVATTPGTGFGVVCANLTERSVGDCAKLGEALAVAYLFRSLPDGAPSRLEFVTT